MSYMTIIYNPETPKVRWIQFSDNNGYISGSSTFCEVNQDDQWVSITQTRESNIQRIIQEYHCDYCGTYWTPDSRGNCGACGAPKGKK